MEICLKLTEIAFIVYQNCDRYKPTTLEVSMNEEIINKVKLALLEAYCNKSVLNNILISMVKYGPFSPIFQNIPNWGRNCVFYYTALPIL